MSTTGQHDPSADELESLCVHLARGAAAIVRDARRSAMAVSAKSTATDLVTEVDRASERWLRREIAARRPDDGVLGEEDGVHEGSTGVRWVVDPIDGTVNFVLGIPYYVVSVAAEVDGVVTAGAVVNPMSGEVFHARLGGGAHLDGDRLTGPRDVALERAVVGTGFAYDPVMRTAQMAVAAPLLPRIADLRRLGSAALDLCFVAAGRLDAYYETGLHPWDHAAGGIIAAEAGCVASGLQNRPPDGRFYAVAGPGLAPAFFAALEELQAAAVSR